MGMVLPARKYGYFLLTYDLVATALAIVASSYLRFDALALSGRWEKLSVIVPTFLAYAAVVYWLLQPAPAKNTSLSNALWAMKIGATLSLSLLAVEWFLASPYGQATPFFRKRTIFVFWLLLTALLIIPRLHYSFFSEKSRRLLRQLARTVGGAHFFARKVAKHFNFGIAATIAVALMSYVVAISLRESSLEGFFVIFCFLVTLVAAIISTARRFCLTVSILLLVLLAALDLADAVKRELVFQHITFGDFILVTNLSLTGAVALVRHYSPVLAAWWNFFIFGAALVIASITHDLLRRTQARKIPRGTSLMLWLVAGLTLYAAVNSEYMQSVRSKDQFYEVTSAGDLRYSSLLSGAHTFINLRAEFASKTKQVEETSAPSCGACPDLIIFHAESVFDVDITTDYAGLPGLAQRLERAAPGGKDGRLLVNTRGGYSHISEFEVLCGVRHAIFGSASRSAPDIISHFTTRCAAQHLKSLGYETSVIYSTQGMWLNVRNVFRNYGFDNFFDTRDLGLSDAIAFAVRDEVFTDKLIEILQAPRTRPRLIWVSTNWNHGPHGMAALKRYGLDLPHVRQVLSQTFPGPFDLSRAKSEEFKDFVNRLNDTYANLERLQVRIMQLQFPVAMLIYGDHQPRFSLSFTDEVIAEYGQKSNFLTFYRMITNSGTTGSAVRKHPTIRIDQIFF